MKKLFLVHGLIFTVFACVAQNVLTPEALWKLGRVSGVGITRDGKGLVYAVTTPDIEQNKSSRKLYFVPLNGGTPRIVQDSERLIKSDRISPDGQWEISAEEVKMINVYGKDLYPNLQKSTAQVYDALNYRHWDEWEDGSFSHIFLHRTGDTAKGTDIMKGLPYDSPQKPFGGDEDFIWAPDGKSVLYVTKPLSGTQYALSTNTDIFQYDIATSTTTNLTKGMMGYDVNPSYSPTGELAWLSMKRDGFEADKQDVMFKNSAGILNLTQFWDGSVESFKWSEDGKKIYFTAAVGGTVQLFEMNNPGMTKMSPAITQVTKGYFDVASIIGISGNQMAVTITDMNHAAEVYVIDLATGGGGRPAQMRQLTHVNDDYYKSIAISKVDRKLVTTTDNKKMLVWVIYPPDFDPAKKYPTLLYCQGGPQSPLTQFYSFRWNFQLMAAKGYIVVAPNRRGMYGYGRAWNEQISKDWGGRS